MSKEEYEGLAQLELRNLERDFRQMLSDKEAMSKKTKTILANQAKIIALLEKEKNILLEKLEFQSKAKTHDSQARKTVEEIANLLQKYEATKTESKEKATQLQDLRLSINKILQKIEDYKLHHVDKLKDPEKEQKTSELLQISLNEEAMKFDQIITENEELRKETDHLLSERIKFNKMFGDFMKDLASGKKMVFDLIEQSDSAYEKRRKIEIQMSSLESESKKEFLVAAREAWDVKQKLDFVENMNKFVGAKGIMRDHSVAANEKECKGNEVLKALDEKLQFYQGLIHEISVEFGQKDLQKLVLDFMKIEEDNFNVFTFLNDQNSRINEAKNEVKSLESAVEEFKAANFVSRVESDHHIYELNKELQKKRKELLDLKFFIQELEEACTKVFDGIKSIFNDLQCDWTPFNRMLGHNENVTANNFTYFMVDIETRLRMICTQFSVTHPQKSGTKIRKNSKKLSPKLTERSISGMEFPGSYVQTTLPPTPCPLCVEVLDSSDKTAIVMPLKPSEIRLLVIEERRKGRWRSVMHTLAECPLPQAQRIMQKKQTGL